MPLPSTMTPIATNTVSSTTSSVTFSNIPQNYTDLIIIANAGLSGTANLSVRFNSDSGSNYSMNLLKGDGSSATAYRENNTTSARMGQANSSVLGAYIFNIMNYSNSTTFKTTLSRDNLPFSGSPAGNASIWISMWRNTAAITSIQILGDGATNVASGSTFTIYGIKAA